MSKIFIFIFVIGFFSGFSCVGNVPEIASKYPEADKKVEAVLDSFENYDPEKFFYLFLESQSDKPVTAYDFLSKEQRLDFYTRLRDTVEAFLSEPVTLTVKVGENEKRKKLEYWFQRKGSKSREVMVIPITVFADGEGAVLEGGVQFDNFRLKQAKGSDP